MKGDWNNDRVKKAFIEGVEEPIEEACYKTGKRKTLDVQLADGTRHLFPWYNLTKAELHHREEDMELVLKFGAEEVRITGYGLKKVYELMVAEELIYIISPTSSSPVNSKYLIEKIRII